MIQDSGFLTPHKESILFHVLVTYSFWYLKLESFSCKKPQQLRKVIISSYFNKGYEGSRLYLDFLDPDGEWETEADDDLEWDLERDRDKDLDRELEPL